MSLAIDAEACTLCGACEPICPTTAISRNDTTFIIDSQQCSECKNFFDTPQCVEVCPVDCIHSAKQSPPTPTVRRAKLFHMVIDSFNRPDSTSY